MSALMKILMFLLLSMEIFMVFQPKEQLSSMSEAMDWCAGKVLYWD